MDFIPILLLFFFKAIYIPNTIMNLRDDAASFSNVRKSCEDVSDEDELSSQRAEFRA